MPSRLARVRAALPRRRLDALLVSSPPDVRYLCGFSGTHALLVVHRNGAALLTDARYTAQAREEARGVRRVILPGNLAQGAAELGLLRGCRTVGYDDDEVSVRSYRTMRKAFPRLRLRAAAGLVAELAEVKDHQEVAAIAEAARISGLVFRELLPLIRPGTAERDIAAEIAFRHRRHGADHDSFEPIVAAGARAALPHARASSARIRRGDVVVLDFGCTVRGYNSDMTRTVGVGRLSAELRRAYAAVREAQTLALDSIRPGAPARKIDAAARALIRERGFGRFFPHALGHGLGLRVHERPRLAPLSAETLRAGQVVTVEPGVYLPGVGGVRIEDDVVVRPTGCEVLTTATKELLIL